MSPTVSLIMATHNRRHTLARAIRSVVQQDFVGWELVVVDEGSSDGTLGASGEFDNPRIQGAFDSDDELVPDALGVLMATVRAHDDALDAVSCNCIHSGTGRFTARAGACSAGLIEPNASIDRYSQPVGTIGDPVSTSRACRAARAQDR